MYREPGFCTIANTVELAPFGPRICVFMASESGVLIQYFFSVLPLPVENWPTYVAAIVSKSITIVPVCVVERLFPAPVVVVVPLYE